MDSPSEKVRAVDRTAPRTARLTVSSPGGEAEDPATVEISFRRGSPRPTSVLVKAPGGLTATDMKRMPWRSWFWVADVAVREMRPEPGTDLVEVVDAAVALRDSDVPVPPKPRPGRRGHPQAHFEAVAEAYRTLYAAGVRNPTQQIAERWNVSRNTASGWIRQARTRGLLPPARQGRAG